MQFLKLHFFSLLNDVLKALVDGLDYKQIAQRYFISLDTVRNHIRYIYEKLQVYSKSEAVAKALLQHLVLFFEISHDENFAWTILKQISISVI